MRRKLKVTLHLDTDLSIRNLSVLINCSLAQTLSQMAWWEGFKDPGIKLLKCDIKELKK